MEIMEETKSHEKITTPLNLIVDEIEMYTDDNNYWKTNDLLKDNNLLNDIIYDFNN